MKQKQPRRRQAHRRSAFARMRRKRLKNTLLLLSMFFLLLAVGAGGIYLLKDGKTQPMLLPYTLEAEFEELSPSGVHTAGGMAEGLCISAGDVEHAAIRLPKEQSGALFDLDGESVLFAQGIYDKVYPASITKLMTAMLAFQYGNLDEIVTISSEALVLEAGSQVCGLQAGDRISLRQLVDALVVYSGNDAAAAIAEHVGGSISGFVEMMNKEAVRLGCTGTHFTNPHGLQDENHYTTPYDIYLMLQEALKYKEFVEVIQMANYTITPEHADGTVGNITLEATDHYLTGEATPPKDVTVLGGKTGTTSLAGNCLALAVQNAYGKPYISIVMGASTKELLYQQMNMLLENVNS